MNITDAHKAIMAAVALLGLGAASVTVFQTQKAAAADKEAVKQEIAKSAADLRVEILLNRVKALNEKKDKDGKLSAAEQTELELNLDQVKAINAERSNSDKK